MFNTGFYPGSQPQASPQFFVNNFNQHNHPPSSQFHPQPQPPHPSSQFHPQPPPPHPSSQFHPQQPPHPSSQFHPQQPPHPSSQFHPQPPPHSRAPMGKQRRNDAVLDNRSKMSDDPIAKIAAILITQQESQERLRREEWERQEKLHRQELERQEKLRQEELERQEKLRQQELKMQDMRRQEELERQEKLRQQEWKMQDMRRQEEWNKQIQFRREEWKEMEERQEKIRQDEKERFERLMEFNEKKLLESRRQHEETLLHKEMLLERKIQAQNAIADRYLGKMKTHHEEETRTLETARFQRNALIADHNSRPRLLCSEEMCQKNEPVPVGTPAFPCYKKKDIKDYFKEFITKRTTYRPLGFDHLTRLQDKVDESVTAVFEEMSFEMNLSQDEGVIKMDVVPILSLDNFVQKLEEVAGIKMDDIRPHLARQHQNLPFSPYIDCDKGEISHLFKKTFNQDKTFFTDTIGPDATEYIRKENVIKPDHIIEELDKEPQQEEQEDSDADALRFGCTLDRKEDFHVKGRYDETPSSIKMLSQRIQSCCDAVREFFELSVKKKGQPDYAYRKEYVERNQQNFRGGLAELRALLTNVKHHLRRFSSYTPFVMERYKQDQKYQKMAKEMEPSHRRYGKPFYKEYWNSERNPMTICYACRKPFDKSRTRTIGHVVPSRGKNTGSDYTFNIVDLCKDCNQESGAMDPHLYDKFDSAWWFVDFKEFDIKSK